MTYKPGCECTVALIEQGQGWYCPACGQEYRRHSGAAVLKAIALHGPLLTREEGEEMQAYLREMRTDDDEQKPETD